MRPKVAISSLTVALALGGAPAWGQIQIQGVTLFAYGGGYSAVHNSYNLSTGSVDDFKMGFTLGGGVGVQVHPHFELRATLTGAQSHLRQAGAETGAYLNRYFVGVDLKGQYPLASGLTPYGLAGGGLAYLYEKGTTGPSKTQPFGHLGLGVSYPIQHRLALFLQEDNFFYELAGFNSGTVSVYHSAQFDVGWSAGASYQLP
jgi:hypothetical protein